MCVLGVFLTTLVMFVACSAIASTVIYTKYGPDSPRSKKSLKVGETKGRITGLCKVNGFCPAVPCKVMDCIPNPTCKPRPWPQTNNKCPIYEPCDPSTCPEPNCSESRDRSANTIDRFFNGFIEQKSVFEWLDMYAPNSKERLQVVTTFLEHILDKWAWAGHVHRCWHGNIPGVGQVHRDTEICSFCNDRYRYIDCVMSEELASGSSRPLESVDDDFIFNSVSTKVAASVYMSPHVDLMALKGRPASKHPFSIFLPIYFKKIDEIRNAFQVTTVSGKTCSICSDFNTTVYSRCMGCHDASLPYKTLKRISHCKESDIF